MLLILKFSLVLNIVCLLLGDSQPYKHSVFIHNAYEDGIDTECPETLAFKLQMTVNHTEEAYNRIKVTGPRFESGTFRIQNSSVTAV
jgi:hypothetical protein